MPKKRPILFNSQMVRAILAGKKTQTRRPVKFVPALGEPDYWCPLYKDRPGDFRSMVGEASRYSPFGNIGELLWVRETWAISAAVRCSIESVCPDEVVDYEGDIPSSRPEDLVRVGESCQIFSEPWVLRWRADYFEDDTREDRGFKWRPAIHMPQWASRLTLKITGIDVQRVKDISDDDARDEGVWFPKKETTWYEGKWAARFLDEWDWIYADRDLGWKNNPWVWVLKFEIVDKYCTKNAMECIMERYDSPRMFYLMKNPRK